MNLIIREVEDDDRNKIIDMYEEYINSQPIPGIDTFEGIRDFENLETMNFKEWIEDLEKNKREENLPKEYSTHTLYIALDEKDKIVGAIGLRWQEVPILMKYGGMVGYSVRPSERGKGYATEMLRFALKEFKKNKKKKILISCKDFNTASRRVIERNGGKFENNYYNNEDGYTYARYWIRLKKKFADQVKEYPNILDIEQKLKTINNNDFSGDIYLNHYKKVKEPFILENGLCICDDEYKWLEFYDYNSKVRLTAIYNDKNEIIEWYFDMAREIGKQNGMPYEDDMYLDVVLRPNGEIELLDENELQEALDEKMITKVEYDDAYKTAYELIEKIKGKEKEVKEFTDKYLNTMI